MSILEKYGLEFVKRELQFGHGVKIGVTIDSINSDNLVCPF